MGVPPGRAGLRTRLTLLVALALAPAIGLLVYRGAERHAAEAEDRRHQALELARMAAQAQARRIEGARQLLVALAESHDIRDASPEECVSALRRLITAYDGIYINFGWADASGQVVCMAHEGPAKNSIADREYFQAVMRTRRFHVGSLVMGRLAGVNIQPYAYPREDAEGRPAGVIFANADPTALAETLAADAHAAAGRITLLDRTGVIVAQSSGVESAIGLRVSDEQYALLRDNHELVTTLPGPDGPRLYAMSSVRDPLTDEAIFYVAYGIPEATLFEGLAARQAGDFGAILLFGLGLLACAWFVTDLMVRRPVQRLVEATTGLAAGRLDTRVPVHTAIPELQALDAAFNQMAERLQQRDLHLRQGQRLEAIGQLAGGIAHDFNNLLTVIVGYGQSLAATVPPGSAGARELRELRAAADRASQLTRQLLAFSRRQVLSPKPIVLGDVATQMQSLLRRTIGTEIALEVECDAAGVVEADPAQIEQVVLNLAINARDALPDGGVIRITTQVVETGPDGHAATGAPAGRWVELAVGDTGTGMDDETRARIFEPFFTTKGNAGTGLGLATVYGIVKQSGGYIGCETAKGIGTTFRILLPLTDRSVDDRPVAAPPAPSGGSEQVIVVEDEPAVRELVEQVLRRMGYQVRGTEDAGHALRWLRDGLPVDLVISDIRMPGISGLALFAEARAVRPEVPIILMSGDVSPTILDSARSSGAAFLQKPFTISVLLSAVRATIDEQRARVA
ncbi:MAG: response regulator [Vicinamibacterales bacterium]